MIESLDPALYHSISPIQAFQWISIAHQKVLTLFDMGGGHDAPQNVFDHCAQTLWRRKLKLGDF